MSDGNFAECLEFTLVQEGGYSDDAGDPGGKTMWGITHREYDAYRDRKGLRRCDVRLCNKDERDEIYRFQYWDAVHGDELPSGLDLSVWDCAVNCGVTRATILLQRCVGADADGNLGIQTLNAIRAVSVFKIIGDYSDRRRGFYRALSTFPRFGKGWIRRANECEALSTHMASVLIAVDMPPTARPAPAPLPGATVKASSKDADKPVVGSATASAATASSGVLSGVVGQLQSLSTQISPFQSTLNLIKYLLIAIALVSAGLAIYAFWKQAKTKEALG